MIKSSLKTEALYLIVGRFIAFALATISPLIIVRLLSLEQYGHYQEVFFVAGVALVLIRFGIPGSLYYMFPRVEGRYSGLLSQTITIMGVISVSFLIIFVVMGKFFKFLPEAVAGEFILPIALYVAVENIAFILDHIFILERRARLMPALNAGNMIVRLTLVISAVVLFRDVLAITYVLVCFAGVRLMFLLGYLAKRYTIRPGTFDKDMLRKQLKYSLPMAGSVTVGAIRQHFSKVVIVALMTTGDFAVFTVGSLGIMNVITLLYTSFGDVCVPRLGELVVQNRLQQAKALWDKMVLANVMVTIPVVVFCFAFADEIITILFTEKYLASANILRINLLILLVQMTSYGSMLRAMGKTKVILLANSISAGFVIPASFLLINRFGLHGAAVSVVVGFWLNALIQLGAGRRSVNVSIREFLPWKNITVILTVSVIPACLLWCVSRLELPSLVILLFVAPIYFGTIFLSLKAIGYLDIAWLSEFLPGPIRKIFLGLKNKESINERSGND